MPRRRQEEFIRALHRCLFGLGGLAAIGLLLSGCAGLHLYNAENDKTAAEAKEASDQLDLAEIVAKERSNQVALLKHEIAVVADFATTQRNAKLRSLLETRRNSAGNQESPNEKLSAKLQRFIDTRLAVVAPADPKGAARAALIFQEAADSMSAAPRYFVSTVGVPAPVCDPAEEKLIVADDLVTDFVGKTAKTGDTRSPEVVRQALGIFAESCAAYRNSWDALSNVGGDVGIATRTLRQALIKLDYQEASVAAARGNYDTALVALKDGANEVDQEASQQVPEKLEQAAKNIRSALKAMTDAGAQGGITAAEIQIDLIDRLLEAVADGEPDGAAPEEAESERELTLTLAAQIPSVAGKLSRIAELRQAPPVQALLLEKQRLLIARQDAERRAQRTKERISLLEQKRDAIVDEIQALVGARQYLQWTIQSHGKAIAVEDMLGTTIAPAPRRYMIMAVALYLETFTGSQRQVQEADYRLIDVDHAEALDRSETALRLWQAAVQQPVTALAAYHGTGIKPEEIVELLKAAGLFAIAGGVNN